MQKRSLCRWALVTVGVMAVGLATVGVFVPILPTTPFLLLAAACFIRSSDPLHRWLMRHRWFGPYIRNYRDHRAIDPRARLITLVLLWASIGYAAIVVVDAILVRALLLLIAIGVTAHLLSLKAATPEMSNAPTAPTEDMEIC